MPRLSPLLLRQARAIDPLLPHLLPVCRDLRSAQSELRWLTEHADQAIERRPGHHQNTVLDGYVSRRARGEPLQYILGSEFFGNLEIKCRPGVLIPRQETAASVSHLVKLLTRNRAKDRLSDRLRILDLCTGSGCIPLLFHHEFYSIPENADTALDIVGIDVSADTLKLARENHAMQIEAQSDEDRGCLTRSRSLAAMRFLQADVLHIEGIGEVRLQMDLPTVRKISGSSSPKEYDILISNPPYISSKAFRTPTSRSVRMFEPKLALVPHHAPGAVASYDGDVFYPRLLDIAEQLGTKMVLFEVADIDQAQRVASLAVEQGIWNGVEIWRDDPGARTKQHDDTVKLDGAVIKVRGAGDGRSVFAYRDVGAAWLK